MKRPRPFTKGHTIATDADEAAARLNIRMHPGYRDPFTRDQSPMAKHANGARIRKLPSDDPTDVTDAGTLGTVLGSIGAAEIGVVYFIEWDDRPRRAVMTHERKVGDA